MKRFAVLIMLDLILAALFFLAGIIATVLAFYPGGGFK